FCPPSPVTYLSLFHPPPPTELYTLSLHDALPILGGVLSHVGTPDTKVKFGKYPMKIVEPGHPITQGASDFEHEDELYYYLQTQRSEEHTSELQSLAYLVCRLLLEKKKK